VGRYKAVSRDLLLELVELLVPMHFVVDWGVYHSRLLIHVEIGAKKSRGS
jgi:hypothetical protein